MSSLYDYDLGLLDFSGLPGSEVGSPLTSFSDNSAGTMSPLHNEVDFLSGTSSPSFLDGPEFASPVGAETLSLLDLGVSNMSPSAQPRPNGTIESSAPPIHTFNFLPHNGGLSNPATMALSQEALLASTSFLLGNHISAMVNPPSTSSVASTISSSSNGAKREFEATSESTSVNGEDGDKSSGDDVPVKKQVRRHKKPRICELSEADATAKRESNRESARKSRERKRQKLDNVFEENENVKQDNLKLKQENMELRLRLQMFQTSLMMGQASAVASSTNFDHLM
eukprot:CFRG4818T1